MNTVVQLPTAINKGCRIDPLPDGKFNLVIGSLMATAVISSLTAEELHTIRDAILNEIGERPGTAPANTPATVQSPAQVPKVVSPQK